MNSYYYSAHFKPTNGLKEGERKEKITWHHISGILGGERMKFPDCCSSDRLSVSPFWSGDAQVHFGSNISFLFISWINYKSKIKILILSRSRISNNFGPKIEITNGSHVCNLLKAFKALCLVWIHIIIISITSYFGLL